MAFGTFNQFGMPLGYDQDASPFGKRRQPPGGVAQPTQPSQPASPQQVGLQQALGGEPGAASHGAAPQGGAAPPAPVNRTPMAPPQASGFQDTGAVFSDDPSERAASQGSPSQTSGAQSTGAGTSTSSPQRLPETDSPINPPGEEGPVDPYPPPDWRNDQNTPPYENPYQAGSREHYAYSKVVRAYWQYLGRGPSFAEVQSHLQYTFTDAQVALAINNIRRSQEAAEFYAREREKENQPKPEEPPTPPRPSPGPFRRNMHGFDFNKIGDPNFATDLKYAIAAEMEHIDPRDPQALQKLKAALQSKGITIEIVGADKIRIATGETVDVLLASGDWWWGVEGGPSSSQAPPPGSAVAGFREGSGAYALIERLLQALMKELAIDQILGGAPPE